MFAVAATLLLSRELPAQQREPAWEVYGLSGAYFHGNLGPREWRPQAGAGVLAPLKRNWGVLFDVTTSAFEQYWKHDGQPGAGPGDNFLRERRIVLIPSVLRLWRNDRFTMYAGIGAGWEHRRQHNRLRPMVARGEHGEPILAEQFQDTSSTSTPWMPLLRIGTIVSVTRRTVLRAGYTGLKRYMDEKASHSFEFGVGWRL